MFEMGWWLDGEPVQCVPSVTAVAPVVVGMAV